MNTGLNLLVVDWDFFFRNPSFSAVEMSDNSLLYSWDHAEAPAYLGPLVWSGRASAFLRNGLPLPMCQDYDGFWDRFTFSPHGVPVLYGDSNSHAGRIMPSTLSLDKEGGGPNRWARVELWDAHHDSGYANTGSLEEWRAGGLFSCQDWMLTHYDAGSRLAVTYPAWRGEVGQVEPEPLVPVERRVDDGTNPDVEFHAVYVCRSGAWVPPWCDRQFSDFLEQAPHEWPLLVEGAWEHPRPDGVAEAREQARGAEVMQQIVTEDGLSAEMVERLLAVARGES